MDAKKDAETRGGTEPPRYGPVLRKVDNPDQQLPPPLNRKERRALRRKLRKL